MITQFNDFFVCFLKMYRFVGPTPQSRPNIRTFSKTTKNSIMLLSLRQQLICSLFLYNCFWWTFCINAITENVIFCIYILLLSVILLSFIHVVVCISFLLFFSCQMNSIMWLYNSLSILPVKESLSCFQFGL